MNTVNFNESCPVCGRKLMVPIEFLGQQVQCSHCKGFFRAQEEGARGRHKGQLRSNLDQRADDLLSNYGSSATAR